jgi:hypothetical protein
MIDAPARRLEPLRTTRRAIENSPASTMTNRLPFAAPRPAP